MREVFKASPPPEPDLTDVIFYTITPEDIGKRALHTTEGWIPGDVLGYIQPIDVGKRLVRVPTQAHDGYVWQAENNEQRDRRLRHG